ncbi:MAG: hypothetical protein IT569_00290, partial [Leptospiraceae bacterium]|nr:hypothetical protein [Leptospiraceae bacterium]
AAITTSDIPVFDKSIFEKNTLVDMEASGFFEAASFFVKPDRIHIIKILSDYMEKERITREFVQNLMKKNLEAIENYLEKLDHSKKEFSAGAITSLCEKLTGHFQLTTTQSVQLKKKITAYMVRNNELPVFLSDYADKKTESKASTKILLGEIFSKLDKN